MHRAESTATVHFVDVSLKSSPMFRSFPRRGNQRCGPPLWGTNGPFVALDFSGTFSNRGYGLSIPNLITLARILAVPVILWAITSGEMRIAFALFLAAGLSDLIDGYLAKRFGMATELGAYLDPLADKAMIVSIYVALGIVEAMPRWLVILVVSRDIMIVGAVILSWLVDKPVKLKPITVSKLNTVAQIVYATIVLAALTFGWEIPLVMGALIGLVTVLTLLSVALYLAEWVRHMNATD
jgi:cardiolipin synthase (CMP-forming)